MLNVFRPLAIVFYVVVVELSHRISVGTFCPTDDCTLTEEDFADFMETTESPCENFFKYTCGKANDFLDSAGYKSQYEFIWNEVLNVDSTVRNVRVSDPINDQDGDVVKWYKQQIQLCDNTSEEKKLQDTVAFFNNLPIDGSWWELETFLVKKGFPSSLFRVYQNNDLMIEFLPLIHAEIDHEPAEDVETLLEMLKKSGLSSSIASLLNGCSANSWAYKVYPTKYGRQKLAALETWPDYWIVNQISASSLSREDWNMYFNSWWSGKSDDLDWVHRVNVTLNAPNIVSQLGELWEDDANEPKSVIACATLRKLMSVAGMPRLSRSCEPMVDTLANLAIERQLFPESLKKGVQKVAAAVELQIKQYLYKIVPKAGNENLFIGNTNVNLYNHLVRDAKEAQLDFDNMVLEKQCCGNCDTEFLKKASARVIRFERRYSRDIQQFWTSTNNISPLSAEMLSSVKIGTALGAERGKHYLVLELKAPDNTTSYVDVTLERERLLREIRFNWNEAPSPFVDGLIIAGQRHVKFRNDRPAALNYGGVGAILAAVYWDDGAPSEYNIETLKKALDIAWKAYVYDKQSGPKDYGRLSTLPDLDDDKLFFLAFANTQCGSSDEEKVDKILKEYQPFKDAYNCAGHSRRPGYNKHPTQRVYRKED